MFFSGDGPSLLALLLICEALPITPPHFTRPKVADVDHGWVSGRHGWDMIML